MVNVELSNIWNCLSLPELLAGEKDLFDAHRHLRANEPGGNDFLGFLGLPDAVTARTLHAIRQAADSIRQAGGTLVVAGHGGPYFAAQAGIDLLLGRNRALRGAKPRVLFTGDNLSSRDWLELCDLLAGEDYSLLLLSPDGAGFETCVASRAMRWMMERRYGPEAKERVYVAAPEGTPLYKMGKEEGYALLPSPRELGGAESALSSGALAAMAAAGIEPLDLLEGAAEAYRTMDVRAFENPAWLYAGSRVALSARGRRLEMIGCFDPSMNSFGLWLKQYLCRHACRDGLGALSCYSASCPESWTGSTRWSSPAARRFSRRS
jgi:glucose-6-phosphate isomerase